MAGFVTQRNPRAGNENLRAEDKVALTTQYSILDEEGNEIGYITDLNENQTRTVEPVRHLNAADAGRILQGVPRPADFTVDVTGFYIYKQAAYIEGSTIARLIQNSGNAYLLMKSLEEQKVPFRIKATIENPNGEDSITVYHGCWITRYTKPFSINQAYAAETVSLFVAYIDEV